MTTSISGTGTLRIQTEQACQVFLDGEPVGSFQSGETQEIELLPGSYVVTAELEGGPDWKKQVRIQADQETQIHVAFEDPGPTVDSPESDRVIIYPGQAREGGGASEQGWSKTWTAIAVLVVAGCIAYGVRLTWPESAGNLPRFLTGSSQPSKTVSTDEATPVEIQVANGSEAFSSLVLLSRPEHGALAFSSDSATITYRPNTDFSGTDRFRYALRRGEHTDTLQAAVKVRAVPGAPRAKDDTFSVTSGEEVRLAPLENDNSPDERPLRLAEIGPSTNGTLRVNDDSSRVTYVPDEDFVGTDRFTYTVSDSRGRRARAAISVMVSPRPPTPSDLDIAWERIAPGSFMMGSDRGAPSTQPPHKVEISTAFDMSAHEITVGQFRKFVEATGYRTDAERLGGAWRAGDSLRTPGLTWRNPGFEQTDEHPVVCVSWNDARAFAEWMGARLPTEAEWEYAARADVTAPKLPGDWDETTWYAGNAEGTTHPVGQKAPNDWGLYDVQGNAWEWVQDWYSPDYYENSPATDPKGPESGELRVCRGGSWHDDACWLPARNRASPTYRANNIGFRVVKSAQTPPD
jgi:formylglycine-generating enzyme required for sulfatase activity